jgi:hypothetical protein
MDATEAAAGIDQRLELLDLARRQTERGAETSRDVGPRRGHPALDPVDRRAADPGAGGQRLLRQMLAGTRRLERDHCFSSWLTARQVVGRIPSAAAPPGSAADPPAAVRTRLEAL